MSGAVAQWFVRATDDQVVAGSNTSVAASKLEALGKFVGQVPTLPVSFVNKINIDFLNEIF